MFPHAAWHQAVLGFFVTGFDDFASDTTEKLIVLGLNPLHNYLHLVYGALSLFIGLKVADQSDAASIGVSRA